MEATYLICYLCGHCADLKRRISASFLGLELHLTRLKYDVSIGPKLTEVEGKWDCQYIAARMEGKRLIFGENFTVNYIFD